MTTPQLGIVFGQYVLRDESKAAAEARKLPSEVTVTEEVLDEFNRPGVLVGAVDPNGNRYLLSVETDLPRYMRPTTP